MGIGAFGTIIIPGAPRSPPTTLSLREFLKRPAVYMKIKTLLIATTALLLGMTLLQTLPVPPYAGDIYPLFRSRYFSELDRQFNTVVDAFLGIKTMARAPFAWIFLEDMRAKHSLAISVYNARGEAVKAPGEIAPGNDPAVLRLAGATAPRPFTELRGSMYYSAIPLSAEGKCRFCHSQAPGETIGVITFERKYDACVYYTWERVLPFSLISLVLLGVLIFLAQWDPRKKIKELFDK